MSSVTGLPASDFVEEAPGLHMWRMQPAPVWLCDMWSN